MLRTFTTVYLLTILCASSAQAGVQRAYVASYGLNSNTSLNCDVAHPCRQFLAAVTVVNPNGEVVALDTAAYGAVTLTQSISLTSAPGAYAGISVFSDYTAGVTINTADVTVVLRGLTINGQGGNYGINMTNGAKLSIENCVISNFKDAGQYGVSVNSSATVRMVNTLVRDNDIGLNFQGGATADISGSKFLGNGNGILAQSTTSTVTSVTVSDTVVTGGGTGIEAFSTLGTSRINMIRATVTNATEGIAASASAGTASITLSESMVTGNATGYLKGTGGTLTSLGNNTITDNTTNTGGPIPTILTQ
jgi:hypothetical protein